MTDRWVSTGKECHVGALVEKSSQVSLHYAVACKVDTVGAGKEAGQCTSRSANEHAEK